FKLVQCQTERPSIDTTIVLGHLQLTKIFQRVFDIEKSLIIDYSVVFNKLDNSLQPLNYKAAVIRKKLKCIFEPFHDREGRLTERTEFTEEV
ncbi:hypothetical protein SDJN02_24109, partial [Cucurbita argyrosperma subsp. argyrosperma]